MKSDFKLDEMAKPHEILKVLFLRTDFLGEEYLAKIGNSNHLVYVRLLNKEQIAAAKFERQLVVTSV